MEIAKENIERIFRSLQLQGVNTENPLLYGYFFVDKNKANLDNLKNALIQKGFLFVDNSEFGDGDFVLQVKKNECHCVDSLIKQLTNFNKLAEEYSVECFDGWDVGNIDETKPLISNENFCKMLDLKNIEEVFSLADELLQNDIFEKAILAFEKCIEENFEVENCLYKQFICFDYLQEPQMAINALKKVLKLNPNHFKACFNIGALSYQLKDYVTSIEFYQKANEIEKNNDNVFYGIAVAQFCIGKLDLAKKNCEIALKLNPNNQNAKELLLLIE